MMATIRYHEVKDMTIRFLTDGRTKIIATLLAIELTFFLLAVWKGVGPECLPVTGVLMCLTVAGCAAAFWVGADRYLPIIVLLLLNLGFTVQMIEEGSGIRLTSFLAKFFVMIAAVLLVFCLYRYLAGYLADDRVILLMMAAQFILGILLYILGEVVGNLGRQGAILTVRVGGISFTPFEVVKFLYLFVAAGLLCKKERDRLYIGRLSVGRESLLIVHTALLSVCFLLCREFGTLLVILLTGLTMLGIFGENRKRVLALTIFTAAGIGFVWFVCDSILYPEIAAGDLTPPAVITKLTQRFAMALHPERDMQNAGYQGMLELEALASGGLFGIGTERHRLPLPEASSDMVFGNVVQTCGFVMGTVTILAFFAFLKRGMEIASACEDTYFQGLASAITFVVTIEAVIHIGYNVVVLPIMGIPLYFVSQGFTAMITAMSLASVLLVISSGKAERRDG